jgi:hypothetical protein
MLLSHIPNQNFINCIFEETRILGHSYKWFTESEKLKQKAITRIFVITPVTSFEAFQEKLTYIFSRPSNYINIIRFYMNINIIFINHFNIIPTNPHNVKT